MADPDSADGGADDCIARRLRSSSRQQRHRSTEGGSDAGGSKRSLSVDHQSGVTERTRRASRSPSTQGRAEKRRRVSTPTERPQEAKKRHRGSSGGSRKTVSRSPEPSTSGQQPQQQQQQRAASSRHRQLEPSAAAGPAAPAPAPARTGRGRSPGQPSRRQRSADRGGPSPGGPVAGGAQPASNTGSCTSSSGRRGSRAGGKVALGGSMSSEGAPADEAAGGSSSAAAAAAAAGAASPAGAAGGGPAAERGAGAAGLAGAAALLGAGAAAEEDGDMGRLQALLEARGIPSHLIGALGPRMQQMLHRSMGSSSKIQQLVQGLQATDDETQQLQAVIEMGQLLVMGNEETLAGFPIKQVVPPLIALLQMEHNFDIMNHACRALTYLMEALPRSTAVVVEAVPVLLQKLQVIQCMDVAEQSLTALELISRRHSKNLLQVGGISACLMYVDFFSLTAQRAALAITANCCLSLTQDEFHLVSDNLHILSERLTHQDKKTVESVCLAFSRLVDTFKTDPAKVKEIARHGLLANVQRLLMATPAVISSSTFCEVTKMLRVLCSYCPDIAVQLLSENIAETLCYLLVGNREQMELVSRNPEELYALMCLVGDLLPALPTDGLFSVDQWLFRIYPREYVQWQWRDDRNNWHNYSHADSFTVETANQAGDDEVQLDFMGRHYTIDFNTMRQINEGTGTSRPIQRRTVTGPAAGAGAPGTPAPAPPPGADPRLTALQGNRPLFAGLVGTLFSILYKVYSSCAGPAVRHMCLRAILRMVYFASPDMLKDLVGIQEVSSHLTGMLSSGDLKIVVAALQLAEVLIQKLPEQCSVHFRREGVVYQINQLAADPTAPAPSPVAGGAAGAVGSSGGSGGGTELCAAGPSSASLPAYLETPPPPAAGSAAGDEGTNLLSDVLKRKRTSKRPGNASRKSRQEEASQSASPSMASSAMESLSRAAGTSRGSVAGSSAGAAGGSAARGKAAAGCAGGSRFQTSSFLASLNPARWGRSVSNSPLGDRGLNKDGLLNRASSSPSLSGSKERVRGWIRERAQQFIARHFSGDTSGHTALMSRLGGALSRLRQPPAASAESALAEIGAVLRHSDISPFEVLQSGLVQQLTAFLTDGEGAERERRLRLFLHVLAGCPRAPEELVEPFLATSELTAPLQALVAKLNACVTQVEQLVVKVHDVSETAGGPSGQSALKYFNQNQLKCNLQRQPDCTSLRQWRGGPVKIDPLALVQAIERYLVIRGYGRIRDDDDDGSDDGDSDDDIDDTLAAVSISQGNNHKLQFVINDHVLPYNMTVFQAIQQFSQDTTDSDSELTVGSTHLFQRTHTIYYRPAPEESSQSAARGGGSHAKKGSKSGASKHGGKRRDELWTEGVAPEPACPLLPYLTARLPEHVTVSDPCLETLHLLRLLHALSRHYGSLYQMSNSAPLIAQSEFINSKVSAKANRQLQDPVIVMTGNTPQWLQQIGLACPFLFPFDTRQLLFFTSTFDRDRALLRLIESSPELQAADSEDRIAPKLERKKRTVSRDDLVRQAEALMAELAGSRALLEVQYENEVGSGLGPTLEFYSQVSRELQRADAELWRGDRYRPPAEIVTDKLGPSSSSASAPVDTAEYIHAPLGLYPAPVARSSKSGTVTRLKSKYKFLGKLMAKALTDFRLLDLPLSVPFYKWLLRQERSMTLQDVHLLDPSLAATLSQLAAVARRRRHLEADQTLTAEQRRAAIEALGVDGCSVEDLGLDFTLPGHSSIELKRGGRDEPLTIHNLDQYLKLLTHWLLYESVYRQMEAFREGFESVFPLENLGMFFPEEIDSLFCGSQESSWDERTLTEAFKPDHGYTHESPAIKRLVRVLTEFSGEQRRQFLSFVTGSPRLPVGGFRALSPPLTIVRKIVQPNENPDDFLPSVMTCVNYLKLPDYTSLEIMAERIATAVRDGRLSFMLS
ncbi:E3 ubiquitin-protein ligase TRIP12-like isoform X2 [Amphibalanus amphitrite]|uniref:E3 ubiquitin-protein ligase TRIP12-like isoform X2 n=1 Tax=Amphibalanus amphitrite TaxID=1232801 RepID=UPI001C9055E9|nr:E3 ubiquitin-protein ligase TRIP12-like isoform X2 [Amphibalanus amphitrite]